MAASNPANVLREVFEMVRQTGSCSDQPIDDAGNVQIYHSPTIVQFYFGGSGPPAVGGHDDSAGDGGGLKGGYVRGGRVEVPVGQGVRNREATAGRGNDAAKADGAAADAGGTKSPDVATKTASMNRRADGFIADQERGWRLSPRHRRLLSLSVQEHPPLPYKEHKRPSFAAQLQPEDEDEDAEEANEPFHDGAPADLSPESRKRYDEQQYLKQVHGQVDADDAALDDPEPMAPARAGHVQTSQDEHEAEESQSTGNEESRVEELVVSAHPDRWLNGLRKFRTDPNLQAIREEPDPPREGSMRRGSPLTDVIRLEEWTNAGTPRSKVQLGRPQSVHYPKMMPRGYRKRHRSIPIGQILLKERAEKRLASEVVATREHFIKGAEEDKSELSSQDAKNEDHANETGEADADDEGDEIPVHHPSQKRRKLSPDNDEEEKNVSERMQKLCWKLTAARVTERAIFEAQISSHSENAPGIEAVRLDHEHMKAKAYRKRIERQVEKMRIKAPDSR